MNQPDARTSNERLDMYSVWCPRCQKVTQIEDVYICASAVSKEPRMKVTEEMITRFLQWRLPDDFHPDAGISFKSEYNVEHNAARGLPPARHQPTGTNLLHAGQARAMLEHVLADSSSGETPAKPPYDVVVGEEVDLIRAPMIVRAEGWRIKVLPFAKLFVLTHADGSEICLERQDFRKKVAVTTGAKEYRLYT